MYQFARTPRWLAGHALAGGLLVIFVAAGFWQLSRHAEVRDRNGSIAERSQRAPLNFEALMSAVQNDATTAAGGGPAGVEHRLVTLDNDGLYWHDAVRIRNRSLRGVAGCHLAVPMRAAPQGNHGVLLVAGWMAQADCGRWGDELSGGWHFVTALDAAATVTGRVRQTQTRTGLGPTDPADGRLPTLARTDVARIDQQSALDLAPVYVELSDAAAEIGGSDGAGTETLRDQTLAPLALLPPTQLDAGPHLGYTIQWFSFAAVAIVGYTLVLRHQARRGDSEQIADD